ncbi:MAG: hypothetical protein GEU78_14605 [Actinobacteria bacterium]|nr:hypothetical protein [Actinomycetota bacterium]
MKVLLPSIDYGLPAQEGAAETLLAARPDNLEGKVVGFADGWAHRKPDGDFGMYPLMEEILAFLSERYELAGHLWTHKPNISHPLTDAELDEFLEKADVVVNGECA